MVIIISGCGITRGVNDNQALVRKITLKGIDKDFSEAIGLVKFDFLGLKTLTVIDNAIHLVKQDPRFSKFRLDEMDY